MGISTTAGSKFYIGTTAIATTSTQYAQDVWTQVYQVEDLGEWGAEAKEITFQSVDSDYTRRRSGIIDNGSITLVCARDPLDPGQQKMRTAIGKVNYNFKVRLQDDETNTATGTTFYFSGPVLSARNQFGGSNDITKTQFVIGIDGKIIELIS